jgi:biotin operon repressor
MQTITADRSEPVVSWGGKYISLSLLAQKLGISVQAVKMLNRPKEDK